MSDKQTKQVQAERQAEQIEQETNESEMKQVDELVKPGRFGVTNKQMIPALKQAVAEQNTSHLLLLKKHYLYAFDKSQRYLSKKEQQYLAQHVTGMAESKNDRA
jgi:hypothetical protein